ncbi:MAG TPA: hypothetical protein VN253_06165 [Kofleriaceae bacterium]|nr:hypothetical protein [Kofleriaceae bacterium]
MELGTGDATFAPMPAVLPVIVSLQAEPFVAVHSRIRGFPPGDPDNAFDPRNPRTKVSATIDAVNLTLGQTCPASVAYVAGPEAGTYDLARSLRLGFGQFPIRRVAGKQARITIEVVGSNGLTARDEKLVTLMVLPGDASRPRNERY